MLTLSRQLTEIGRNSPGKTAIEFGEESVSYGELAIRAGEFASFISESQIESGDRVALCVDNSLEYVVALYGCWMAGAIVCPISANAKAREIRKVVDHSSARLLVADADNRPLRAALSSLSLPVLMIPRGRTRPPVCALAWQEIVARKPVVRAESDLSANAMILYTSGTTGNPKGVLLSHKNLAANIKAINAYLQPSRHDRVLAVLPFHYSYGNSVLLTTIAAGATIVLGPKMAYPQEVVDTIRSANITAFSGVPASFAMLLKNTDWAQKPGKLRYVTQAGGPMGVSLTQQLLSVLGSGTLLFVMYGQTEASARLTYVPPESLSNKLGSVGIPVSGVEICILDDEGRQAGPNVSGNVMARGPNIMAGYWHAPEATVDVLINGWLRTGDRGYLDRDGYLYLQGRSSDMIKTGAHRVSPEEIEEVACEVPGIHEAAAIGVADELMGEVIHLYVKGDQSPQLELALTRYIRQQLASNKVPSQICWIREMPRTESGKLQRHKLVLRTDKETR